MLLNNKFLVIRLEAPMQSYGLHSPNDQKTTFSFPTKSAIVGLICASLDIQRDDENNISEISKLKTIVIETPYKNICKNLLIDFQTAGGGKFNDDRKKIKNVNGKIKSNIIINKHYMVDTKFFVILEGSELLIEKCANGLKHPCRPLFLGRKKCIPSAPIFNGIYNSYKEACEFLKKNGLNPDTFNGMRDVDNYEEGDDTLNDVPINFLTKKYGIRRVSYDVFIE